MSPPAFLAHHNQLSDNEDEWGTDDAPPINIPVTHAAPLASYEDNDSDLGSFPSPMKNKVGYLTNDQPHHYGDSEHFESIDAYSEETVTYNVTQNGNGCGNEPVTGAIEAVALYDYQASDSDEISFDPGDVIRDIIKVCKLIFRYLGVTIYKITCCFCDF